MSRTAPTKNIPAPMKVNELATVALVTSPVSGTMKAPAAEMPNAMDPIMLMAAILHVSNCGFQHHNLSQTSMSARPLAARKQIEPKASGAHTSASSWRVAKSRRALKVLILNQRRCS